MAKTSVERMYDIIFDISSKLASTLEDAQQLVSISHEYGGMISKIIEEQILQYFVPSIKDFVENPDNPGSLKGLVNFLDSVPLKQTRLTPGEYSVETLESSTTAEEESSLQPERVDSAPKAAEVPVEDIETVDDLPKNTSFANPLPEEDYRESVQRKRESNEEDSEEEEYKEEEDNEDKEEESSEASEEKEKNGLIRWTVVRTHSIDSSFGNDLKDNIVGEFKSEDEAFDMMDRLNDLITPGEKDLLGTSYAVEKITVISSDHEPEKEDPIKDPIKEGFKVSKISSSKRIKEDCKITYDLLDGSYKPWSGAVDTWNTLTDNGLLEELDSLLCDIYPDGLSETELNDLLWFESDWLFEALGILEEEEEEDEEEDEE